MAGVLPVAMLAEKRKMKACMVPRKNQEEACMAGNIPVIGVKSLQEALDIWKELAGGKPLQNLCSKKERTRTEEVETGDDFCRNSGSDLVRRAAEVAVSGLHNFLMIGPPGSGKSPLPNAFQESFLKYQGRGEGKFPSFTVWQGCSQQNSR